MPGANGADGMTTTALSPPRMALAVPLVFDRVRTQVATGPDGPFRLAIAPFTADGMRAISGKPTVCAPHPQKVRGSGDSATKRVRLVVAPLPGKTTGTEERGMPGLMPRSTSSVPPEFHRPFVGFGGLEHMPNPALVSDERSRPIAWNGPVIHRSMWLRAVADPLLETATLPLLPAWSPSAVYPGVPGASSWAMSFSSIQHEWFRAPADHHGFSVTGASPDWAR